METPSQWRGGHPNARKTHCPQGHEYTPENTYAYEAYGRRCRTCAAEQYRARRDRLIVNPTTYA